jgi:hypothetical protein
MTKLKRKWLIVELSKRKISRNILKNLILKIWTKINFKLVGLVKKE